MVWVKNNHTKHGSTNLVGFRGTFLWMVSWTGMSVLLLNYFYGCCIFPSNMKTKLSTNGLAHTVSLCDIY